MIYAAIISAALVLIAPVLLIGLLKPALRAYENPASATPLENSALVVAYFVDLIVARTSFPLLAGCFPRSDERTVSDMLERLVVIPGQRQQMLIRLAKWINAQSPSGQHIKSI